ncbi:MAG: cyclic nucleotide-binding domain-containing protein [Atopobiaceae bacterium]|nr:cyclic nucleotide-binding domain-containing protein [Atopobiaceae bacterium]
MKEEKFRKGQIVVLEGQYDDCLYYIRWGSVGVFVNYGKKNEEKLAELRADDYFGEMALLNRSSRSATVVSLEHGTILNRITENEFNEFLREKPARVMDIFRGLCHKLRAADRSYLEICKAVNDSVDAQVDGMDASTTYGFAQNDTLRAIHDDVHANEITKA